jgi:hypothetical protein
MTSVCCRSSRSGRPSTLRSNVVFVALVVKKVPNDPYVDPCHEPMNLMLTESPRNPPIEWKYAQFPGSFKTCLQQMVSEGYTGVCDAFPFYILIQPVIAFETAQKSMTTIQNRSSGMPKNIQNAVKIVFEGSPEEVEALLPDMIQSVLEGADACKLAAEEAERSFEGLTGLAQDMVLACTNKVGLYFILWTNVLNNILDR